MSLHETLDQALRLAEDEFEAAFTVTRFLKRPITPAIEAQAAEIGLTTYQSLLLGAFAMTSADGYLDLPFGPEARDVLRTHADRDFIDKLFPMLKVGSNQWQIWAPDDEWDEWYSRTESA